MWLDAVKCMIINQIKMLFLLLMFSVGHHFLWKINIQHGDPSLWNIMYNPHKSCGILVDYDLAVIEGQSQPSGTGRTGTISFMAVDLLIDEYWEGKVDRLYCHELQAFIWVLPFVFLSYKGQET